MGTKLKETSDLDLIELSGKWVYKSPQEDDELTVNGNIYIVKEGVYNTSNGLDYMIVENVATGEISMVFQGTQGFQDMVTDGTLPGAVPDAQLKDAEAAFNTMSEKYNITNVSGNSLGGGLSNYVATKHDVNSVTYNPAILPEGSYNTNNPRITNYMSEYDPLTLGERSAGYMSRLPGNNVILHNNMPWMKTMISNHVGYDDDVVINGQKIQVDADAYLPVGVWSGEILSGSKGQKIDINPENMRILATTLSTRMNSQVKTAQTYLDEAVDIVNHEGAKLDDRQTTLQQSFDDLLQQNSFGGVLVFVGQYEALRNELEEINPNLMGVIDVVQEIRTTPVISEILDFVSTGAFSGVISWLYEIPWVIGDTILKLDEVFDRVSHLKNNAIPKLFNGITNDFFNDAMIAELKAHYNVIDSNKDIVTSQIITFSTQVKYVSDEIEKADKLLTETERVEKAGPPPVTSNFTLEESNALKDGMGKKQLLLDENFKEFCSATSTSLKPALANLKSTMNQLYGLVKDALVTLKNIRSALGLAKIPFTDIDNNAREALDGYIASIEQWKMMLKGVKKAVGDLEGNLDNILNAYRPYIDTALFEGTKFHDVILLNKASYNAFESAEMVFQDIQYQLSGNKAQAVTALDGLANRVVVNLETLLNQIKRGSITI
ncbi:SA1320 family protein [Listeria sp. ILCC792]|uniref:SA1320 family protein n=1 Tax=Listeria sp. ILCC792 TaxID=1918331 RepID=UPI000B5890F6|nr:hypothetical protein [Listeria sp. ILCC792]